jgi:hypothetical protein
MASESIAMNIGAQGLEASPQAARGSHEALVDFFERSPAAVTAASCLREGAEVGLTFTDGAEQWHFRAAGGRPVLQQGKPAAPDFELRIGPGAVDRICSQPGADIGDLGVAFFEQMVARRPEDRIRVTLHSGLVKLTTQGWLRVLAQGGPKVVRWLAQYGLSGPGAVTSALARLKG